MRAARAWEQIRGPRYTAPVMKNVTVAVDAPTEYSSVQVPVPPLATPAVPAMETPTGSTFPCTTEARFALVQALTVDHPAAVTSRFAKLMAEPEAIEPPIPLAD